MKLDNILKRLNDYSVKVLNDYNVDATLYANKEVPIEAEGVEQLLTFLSLQENLDLTYRTEKEKNLKPFWGENKGSIEQVVITPDFHRGGGIPVGVVAKTNNFVIPSAVGNDVCCGMRLLTTDITRKEIQDNLVAIKNRLREVFFKGQRNIPMSPRQRTALLRNGLWGLLETISDNQSNGLWNYYDPRQQEQDLLKTHFQGVLEANDTFAFQDYIKSSGNSDGRDPQIGSVGGGNHFVEIQYIDEVIEGSIAHQWGISKDTVTIMAHSGSLGLGHMVGGYYCGKANGIYPEAIKHPNHNFYVIPTTGPHESLAKEYLDAMRNAANFAFANRLCLGLMAVKAISEAIGREVNSKLIYDAPHNLIWEQGDNKFLHRKGACPAIGPDLVSSNSPFQFVGAPVIIPGSMGSSSYLLSGNGNTEALCSACHGAGRSLDRGKSTHVTEDLYNKSMERVQVVTAIDPESHQVKSRPDILEAYHHRLKEEAPYAYKDITPVVKTVEDANIANRVARMWPMITVKG